MNKDVIYIDVDDDVTAIIGKIKKAKAKVVAIVPPKRPGALQSAVNLRLLDRMAKTEKKSLVLVTANQALVALAANASIPVAKNLQSKPELAEIPALVVDDSDDIIDGSELPVGDHAKTVKVKDGTRNVESSRSEAIDEVDIDGEEVAVEAATTGAVSTAKKTSLRSKVKIPNFDKFRKRLFLAIGGGVALIALLVWMFVFAPSATVVVTAQTSPAPVSASVRLGGTQATNYEEGVVRSVSQQEKKDASVEFDATGTGEVGEKASGTISIENCDGPAFTIPANTVFTANTGQRYVNSQAIPVGALSGSASACRATGAGAGTGSGSVIAEAVGDDYNVGAKTRGYTISGVSGDIYASGSAMTGGSSRTVKVVSAEDIERARGQLIGESTEEDKQALIAKFANGEKVIDSSFTVERGDAVSSPALNEEAPASGKAKLTITTTLTIQAIPKADLETYLDKSLEAQLEGKTGQKIYNTGIDDAALGNFRKDGDTMTATLTATGSIGPELDEAALKEQVKGKIYGEVQSTLESMDGIQEVDVQFSYFWVRRVPGDINKIQIEFKVQNEE